MKTLYLLLSVVGLMLAEETEKEMVLITKGGFQLSSDVDSSPIGKTSIRFKVKSCGTIVIAIAGTISLKGDYMLIFLDKTKLSIRDSCFACTPKRSIKVSLLSCSEFRQFWISWDNMGSVRFGKGDGVGEKLLLEYTSPKQFPVRYLQIASLKPPSTIRFLPQENEPPPHVLITVEEDVAIGSEVYQFVGRPDSHMAMMTRNTPFRISGRKLHITARLDFETKKIYELKCRSIGNNKTTMMTVLVEDVNDEKPEITTGDHAHIPEELPIGFVIGGIFTAKDRDAQDNLKYRLEGEDSHFLSVVGNGELRVERRIDRDGPNGRRMLDKLTLYVEDSAHHKTTTHLSIGITDINDNPPTFTQRLLSRTIGPNERGDKPIVDISCSDEDSNRNGEIRLQIVPSSDGANTWKMFWISGFELYANIDDLRKEYTIRGITSFALTVLAVDYPKNGQANTGSIVVVVDLPHQTPARINDYVPKWTSPLVDTEGNFPTLVVPEHVAPGTVIGRYQAQDMDRHPPIIYSIKAITDGNKKKNIGPFMIDIQTGVLKTTGVLDADQETGGVNVHNFHILATDGVHFTLGSVKVIVKDTNDNPPQFAKTVYIVSIKNKTLTDTLLDLGVQDYDKNSHVTLSLARDDLRYFRLTPGAGNKWSLKFRDGIDPKTDATVPCVILVTANDGGIPPKTSQAFVILQDLGRVLQNNAVYN